MENNKSPGSDGIPAEFYKLFRQDVNIYLVNALNAAYRKGVFIDISASWINNFAPDEK